MKKVDVIPSKQTELEKRHFDEFECRTPEGEFGCQCCCRIQITMNPTNREPPQCCIAMRQKADWLRVKSNVVKEVKTQNFGEPDLKL